MVIRGLADEFHKFPDFYYWGPQPHTAENDAASLGQLNSGSVACDVETDTLDATMILGVSFSPNSSESYYYEMDSPIFPWGVLENPKVNKIFHNGHFDVQMLMDFYNINTQPVLDTLIAAQLLGLPNSLHNLTETLFGISLITIEDLLGKKGKNQLLMTEIHPDKVARKCLLDSLFTMRCWEQVKPHIPWPAFALDMEVLPKLVDVQRRGMRVDMDAFNLHKVELTREVNYYRGVARGMGFNPGSSQQVSAVLESRGWIIDYDRKTGKPRMDKMALNTKYAADPVTQLTLVYREKSKLLSTYIKSLEEKHIREISLGEYRVYQKIHQNLARSGRFSSSAPNNENIPEYVKNIYIPSDGCYYEEADLSQIELRVLAHISQDPALNWAYNNDLDIHTATASMMYNVAYDAVTPHQRRLAKTLNFLIIYGGDEWTMYQRQQIPMDEGRAAIEAYFNIYQGVAALISDTHRSVHRLGYTETLMGRRRYFPNINCGDPRLERAEERSAFNHIIQGTAAEDLKKMLVRLRAEPVVNLVHDSNLADLELGTCIPRDFTENLSPYRTPVEIKAGMNWRDMNKVGVFG